MQRLKDVLYNETVTVVASLLKKAGIEGSSTSYNNELTKSIEKYEQKMLDMEKDFAIAFIGNNIFYHLGVVKAIEEYNMYNKLYCALFQIIETPRKFSSSFAGYLSSIFLSYSIIFDSLRRSVM